VRNNLVAQRYAKAALKNVERQNHQIFREDIIALLAVFAENKEYITALNSFLFPLKERLELAEKVAAELRMSNVWKSLFQLLIKKHRFNILNDILDGLEYYILAEDNKLKVTLTMAFEHNKEMINEIVNRVEKELKSKIEKTIVIDPTIIGGFIAETETVRIDGSIQNNLVRLVQTSLKDFK